MTIKWVKVDPLVMNGEPFCYGSRLTVRQVLELRRNGYTVVDLLKDHPELRLVGIASAYAYAADHRDRYAEFFEADGSLAGPGYTEAEAAELPESAAHPRRRHQAGGRHRLTRPQALAASASADGVGAGHQDLARSSSPPGVRIR